MTLTVPYERACEQTFMDLRERLRKGAWTWPEPAREEAATRALLSWAAQTDAEGNLLSTHHTTFTGSLVIPHDAPTALIMEVVGLLVVLRLDLAGQWEKERDALMWLAYRVEMVAKAREIKRLENVYQVRVGDACEPAFHGFALDIEDECAGLWGAGLWEDSDDGAQEREATRALLLWAGWIGEGGEVVVGLFPPLLQVPKDTSAELLSMAATVLYGASEVEGEQAEDDKKNGDSECAKHARAASSSLFALARSFLALAEKRKKQALKTKRRTKA